jgi:hypothetical protein
MITLRPEKLNQGVLSFIQSKERELNLMWESNLENHLKWINHQTPLLYLIEDG